MPVPHLLPRPALLLLGFLVTRGLWAQSVVVNDTFGDGDRANQAPPNSLAWFQNSATAANLAVRNGALDVVVANNPCTIWAYFPKVTLNVGDTLTLSLDFNFTAAATSGLRVALLSTNGVPPLQADARSGPTGSYLGYGVFGGTATVRDAVYKRDGSYASNPTSAILDSLGSGATSIWASHAGASAPGGPTAANTPFTVVMTITRTGPDSAVVSTAFSGTGLTSSGNVSYSDPAGIVSSFDTLALDFITNSLAGDLIVTRANIIVSSAPVFTAQPSSRGVAVGSRALFTVGAAGNPAPSYQWQRKAAGSSSWSNVSDGSAYTGTASAALLVSSTTAAMDGDQFRVIVSGNGSSATSDAATLALVPAASVGRIINLSILTGIASAGDSFTMGFVVGGDGAVGTKPLVIRAAGPSLAPFGVSNVLVDPTMDFYAGSTRSGGNDDWGGGNDLAAAMSSVGAFSFASPTSKDAAAFANLPRGSNSVIVSANGNGTGAVLAEIYDATPAATFGATTPRLINVSVLKPIGGGMTAGFVIGGSTARPVLIRAIGPSLAAYGVTSPASDPQFVVFDGNQATVGQNNDWGGGAALSAAFNMAGAFPLPPDSKDAALVTTLVPGLYTVQVSNAGGATGTVLIEVYELP